MCAEKLDKLRERASAAVVRAVDGGNAVGDQADLGSLYPCLGMTSEATNFQKPGANGIVLTQLSWRCTRTQLGAGFSAQGSTSKKRTRWS